MSMDKEQLRETDQACLDLIGTTIEVAFSFLRMAEVEISRGDGEHATELIAKAAATHNVVVRYTQNMRAEFEVEKQELCLAGRRLLEAIRAAERCRRQSGFKVL